MLGLFKSNKTVPSDHTLNDVKASYVSSRLSWIIDDLQQVNDKSQGKVIHQLNGLFKNLHDIKGHKEIYPIGTDYKIVRYDSGLVEIVEDLKDC